MAEQEIVRGLVEKALDISELVTIAAEGLPYSNQFRYAALRDKRGNLRVKPLFRQAGLKDVADDKRLVEMLMLVLHKIESDRQRIDIQTIAIIDKQAVIDTLAHLKSHFDRHQRAAPQCNGFAVVTQIEHQSDAMHCILDRCAIYKRNLDRENVFRCRLVAILAHLHHR